MTPRNGYSIAVEVTQGRWKGRRGIQTGTHTNPGGPGGQQGQSYPVVVLWPEGRKKGRKVRVLAVKPVHQRST